MAESDTTPGLPVRRASALNTPRDGDNNENDNIYDNALVLTCDQLQEVDDFCNQLHGKTDDDDKLQLCAEKCNELLRDDTRLQILIATYDDVMSAACRAYENKKREKTGRTPLPIGRNKKTDNNAERDEWERYFGVATYAAQVKSNCLVALKAVAVRWGREAVLHYQWASKGERFCNLLRAAALDVPKWADAALALNIIMSRRHVDVKRHCGIACSRDPITPSDLKELKGFPMSEIRNTILPAGFGLDEFGIIVHEQFALPRPPSACSTRPPAESDLPTEPSDRASDSELSDPPDTESSEPPTASQHSEAAEDGLMDDATTDRYINELLKEMEPELETEAERTISQPPPVPAPQSLETNSPNPPTGMSLRERTQLSYKDTPSRGSRTRSTPVKASAAPKAPPPCCPVPSTLLGALDNTTPFKPESFFAIRGQLCHYHTKRLLEQVWTKHPAADQAAPSAHPPTRRRTASLSDITQPFKRPRLEDPPLFPSISAQGTAPSHDQEADEAYRKQVLAELQYPTHTLPPDSHGKQTADLVQALLGNIIPPNTDRSRGPVDTLFCTGSEAADLVQSVSSHSVPIITEGQQQFRWSKNGRPIVQLFHRMTYLDRTVSVQILSRNSTEDPFEDRTLGEVQQRFLMGDTVDPWKILDLQSPLPSSILPNFLTGENCGLLLHVRDTVLMEKSAERVVALS